MATNEDEDTKGFYCPRDNLFFKIKSDEELQLILEIIRQQRERRQEY